MAWGEADFYDGAQTQGHELGVTRREIIDAARWAEFVVTHRFARDIDRAAVLNEFGFAQVKAQAGTFFAKIIPQRPKRPREVVAFFVVRPSPNPGVRFIGFSPLKDYAKGRREMNESLGILAYFAIQDG